MHSLKIGALASGFVVVAACGSSTQVQSSATSGGTTGATSSSSSTSSSGAGGASSSSSTSTSSSTGTGGAATICGGKTGGTCTASEYCDFLDGSCGVADQTGVCKPKGDKCNPMPVGQVCGCDGVLYGDACAASSVGGVDIKADPTACMPTAAQFVCGPSLCDIAAHYCQHSVSDVSGEPDGYACMALPAACNQAGPTCACLAGEPCGTMCTQAADKSLELTCPGG